MDVVIDSYNDVVLFLNRLCGQYLDLSAVVTSRKSLVSHQSIQDDNHQVSELPPYMSFVSRENESTQCLNVFRNKSQPTFLRFQSRLNMSSSKLLLERLEKVCDVFYLNLFRKNYFLNKEIYEIRRSILFPLRHFGDSDFQFGIVLIFKSINLQARSATRILFNCSKVFSPMTLLHF